MIPGQNLLQTALRVLGQQAFDYYAFQSRTPNEIGQDVTTYANPVTLRGSVQAVPRNVYQQYGLDFQRTYINIYVSQAILDVQRDVSGDLINFNNNSYQCISVTPWNAIDGWNAVLCVQIPYAQPNTP